MWHCHNCAADIEDGEMVWGSLDAYGPLDEPFCPHCDSMEVKKKPRAGANGAGQIPTREVEDAH